MPFKHATKAIFGFEFTFYVYKLMALNTQDCYVCIA